MLVPCTGGNARIGTSPERTPPPMTQPTHRQTITLPASDGGASLTLLFVPGGVFRMGSRPDEHDASHDEQPQHERTVAAFFITQTPITIAQYRPFVAAGGYTTRAHWSTAGWAWRTTEQRTQPYAWDSHPPADDRLPVTSITWHEATAYTRWLTAATGTPYRLPDEAEWERAARGDDGRRYPWGDAPPDASRAVFAASALPGAIGTAGQGVQPVGTCPAGASPYGVLDMAGNVWEWTRNVYHHYPSDAPPQHDEATDATCVLRGGSYGDEARLLRCAVRFRIGVYGTRYTGLRVVCAAVPAHQ